MKYNKGLMLSTTVALLVTTGCVKPTEQVNTTSATTTTTGTVASTENYTPLYEDSTTLVYDDPATSGSGTTYGGTVTEGTTITTNGYETVDTTPVAGNGAYGNPYYSGGSTTSSTTSYGGYDEPTYSYGSGSSAPAPSYTTNTSYSENTTYATSGIHLQVAALRDYASAESFKNSLGLVSPYSAYIKRGSPNKVIITGFSSRSEAKNFAASRGFDGAFIVSGSDMGGGASAYTSSSSYTAPSSATTGNGIGVQVGAFSSKAAARAAAESAAAGRYTAIVKTATVRGRTIYKAILLGFSSASEARSAIASGQFGDAFVVTNIH